MTDLNKADIVETALMAEADALAAIGRDYAAQLIRDLVAGGNLPLSSAVNIFDAIRAAA